MFYMSYCTMYKVYFPERQSENDIEVHGIDEFQTPEYTLCRMAWEEWDCGYNLKERVTDKPITCKSCINVLEHMHKFKKIDGKWY